MKIVWTGLVVMAGALWISSCAPVDPAAGGAHPASKPGMPGLMQQGGMLDDELNFGRTYQ